MQVLVAGMHRSGTSIVTRLLSLAGLYVGTPDELMQGMPDNPGGYWERKDICELNTSALNAVNVDWNTTLGDEIERLGPTQRRNLVHSIRDVIHGLEQNRPWVIKDPRLSVVLPLWKPLLSDPVIVICHRNPLEIARSLRGRDGMPISIGVALWEVYTLAILQNTRAMPRILISHEELLSSTHETAEKLVSRLRSLDSSGIEMPSMTTIKGLINKKLHRSRVSEDQAAGFLSRNHLRLMDSLAAEEELDDWSLNDLSASSRDLIVFYRESPTAEFNLRKHPDGMRVRCDAVKRERDELAKRLESVTAESCQSKLELQASQIECGNLSGRLMQAHEDMQRLGSLVEQTNAEKDAIGEELRKLHGSHQEMGTKLEFVASEADAARLKTRSLETTMGELEQELARSREEGIGLKSRLEQLHRDMEAIGALLKKTADEKQALAVELQKTHNAKAELGLRFDEVNLASQKCQGELDTLGKVLGDAESALNEAIAERDEFSVRIQELNGRLQETTIEFDNLRSWRRRLEEKRIFRIYRWLQAVFHGNRKFEAAEMTDRESGHADDRL
jgi:hypothetical protein